MTARYARVPTASHLQLPRHGYSYGSSLRPVAWASPLVLQPALMQQPVSTSSSAQALRCLPQAKATNSFDSVAAVADSGSESDGNETFYTGAAGDGSAGASSQFVLLPSHQINRRQRRAFRREARRLLAAPSKGAAVTGVTIAAASLSGRSASTGSSSASTKSKSKKSKTSGSSNEGAGSTSSTTAAAAAAVAVAVATPEEVVSGPRVNNIVPALRARWHRALVLDSSYRPINVIPWYKAVNMEVLTPALVLLHFPLGGGRAPSAGAPLSPKEFAVSGRGQHPLPAVMRVDTYMDLREVSQRLSCTRRNIMTRDKFSCQYCGARRDLTLDHVTPVSRGGKDTWQNLVTACMACNQKKGSHSLQTLGWRLRSVPREPKPFEIGVVVGLSSTDIERPPAEWVPYIAHYREKMMAIKAAAREAGVEEAGPDSESEESDGELSGAAAAYN